MCCFFASLLFFGPRFAFLVYWILVPLKVRAAFAGFNLPVLVGILGLAFAPFFAEAIRRLKHSGEHHKAQADDADADKDEFGPFLRRGVAADHHQKTRDAHYDRRRDPAHPVRGRLPRLHLQFPGDDGEEVHDEGVQ